MRKKKGKRKLNQNGTKLHKSQPWLMKADRFERDMKEQSVKWKRTATSHLGKQPSHLAHTLSRPLHIFWKSRSLVPINGSVPLSNVYKRTPQLQISAGLPYDCLCTTSGAIKWGVPTLPKKKRYPSWKNTTWYANITEHI